MDTLVATRSAQRIDMVSLIPQAEIAGPSAVARIKETVNDARLPSRAALEQRLALELSGAGAGKLELKLPGSKNVTLSALARAVSALLISQTDSVLKIQSSEPLWPHSRPPETAQLTARLAQTVVFSGLFYESHLQQFAAGLRPLELMVREPQAGLAPASSPTASEGAAPAASLAADMDAFDSTASPGSGHQAAAAATLPDANAETKSNGPVPFATVYGQDGKPGKISPQRHETAGEVQGLEVTATEILGDLRSSSAVTAVVHPDAMGLVRQQLELLAVPVFRWCGEAWPGTPLEWDVQKERSEDAQALGGPVWTTNLTLSLPVLKSVQARLTLVGNTLQVRLLCDEDVTLAVLHESRNTLAQRFGPLGLQLATLHMGLAGMADGTGLPNM